MKRSLMIGIAGGALAFALIGGAAAATATYEHSTVLAAQTTATATATPNQPARPRAGAPRGPGMARGAAFGLIQITATETKQTPQQVHQELRAGKTLAQIAQEHGSSSDAVIAAARTALQTRLAAAVQNGKLTQAQADARLAAFDKEAPTLMTSTTLGTQPGRPNAGARGAAFGLIQITATETKQTPQQVHQELRAGKTLAQIAQEHGSSSDAVIAAARTALQTRLATAVQNGKLTQAQADARLAAFDKEAPTLMTKTFPARGGKPGATPQPDA